MQLGKNAIRRWAKVQYRFCCTLALPYNFFKHCIPTIESVTLKIRFGESGENSFKTEIPNEIPIRSITISTDKWGDYPSGVVLHNGNPYVICKPTNSNEQTSSLLELGEDEYITKVFFYSSYNGQFEIVAGIGITLFTQNGRQLNWSSWGRSTCTHCSATCLLHWLDGLNCYSAFFKVYIYVFIVRKV